MVWFQTAQTLGIVGVFVVHLTFASLVSVPFDNFRIECPQNAGVQRLNIRMVESQGMKRQDTVFSISCNNINELYPWNGIPTQLAALEREECHYSATFDPIIDPFTEFSCGPREYIASIVRLFSTKIQVGCCKLRTRDETDCVVQQFGKPLGVNVRTEIENQAMLINAISMGENYYRVRFCNLVPRAAEDAKKAALQVRPTTTTSTVQAQDTQPSPITLPIELTQTVAQVIEPKTDSPKRIIKIKQLIAGNRTQSTAKTTTLPQTSISDKAAVLTFTLQTTQSVDNIDENKITSVKPYATSITAEEHKAKDALQDLTRIQFDTLNKSAELINETRELETVIQNQQIPITIKTASGETAFTASETTYVSTSVKPESMVTALESTTKSDTSNLPLETTQSAIEASTPTNFEAASSETTAPAVVTFEPITETVTITSEWTTEAVAIISEATTEMPAITVEPTTEWSTTQSRTTEVVTNSPPLSKTITEASVEQTKAETTKLTTDSLKNSQFVVADIENTETMFPKMLNNDYDDEVEPAKEDDKLMKSIMQMMDVQKQLDKLTRQLKVEQPVISVTSADSQPFEEKFNELSRNPQNVMDGLAKSKKVQSAVELKDPVLVERDKKPTNKNQIKVDKSDAKKQKDLVQTDRNPLISSSLDEGDEPKADNSAEQTTFDFSAFPQEPANDQPLQQPAVELPKYSRFQSKSTIKLPPTVASTTTKEPDYLIADRLENISESISLKPRRNFIRTSTLRRRPISPVVDEETNNSPFDDSGDVLQKASIRSRKTDLGFVDENVNHRDLFDQNMSDEHASEGRFSLPTNSRFSQRSPFEIRRAPTPHIKETYSMFKVAEKYTSKTERPQSVDILFEAPIGDSSATTQPLPLINHRDGERYFTPVDNKPMKMPEMVLITQTTEERPTKLTLLRKRPFDTVKAPEKQVLPDLASQLLIPMSEPSSTQTVQLFSTATTAPSSSVSTMDVELTTASATTAHSITPATTEESTSVEAVTITIPTSATAAHQLTESTVASIVETIKTTSPIEEAYSSQQLSTDVYNPMQFYHTLPPRKPLLREKILTFCSKDTAIRDSSQMVIACGVESEVWAPNRCPPGTDCFVSADSLYRICCPVNSK